MRNDQESYYNYYWLKYLMLYLLPTFYNIQFNELIIATTVNTYIIIVYPINFEVIEMIVSQLVYDNILLCDRA